MTQNTVGSVNECIVRRNWTNDLFKEAKLVKGKMDQRTNFSSEGPLGCRTWPQTLSPLCNLICEPWKVPKAWQVLDGAASIHKKDYTLPAWISLFMKLGASIIYGVGPYSQETGKLMEINMHTTLSHCFLVWHLFARKPQCYSRNSSHGWQPSFATPFEGVVNSVCKCMQ